MRVHLDFETRSQANLTDVGAYRYSEDYTTEILCASYCVDDGPIITLEGDYSPLNFLAGCGAVFVAHNAQFEMSIWNNILVKRRGFEELPPDRWECTMAKALARGYPASLDEAAKALGLSVRKDAEGRKVMLKMSKPRTPTKKDPDTKWHFSREDFEKLKAYNRTDVEVERLLDVKLPPLNFKERKIWVLCQEINQRGLPVDLELAEKATALWSTHVQIINEKINELTGGQVKSATQSIAITKWIRDKGVNIAGVTKEEVAKILEQDIPEECRLLLSYRQQASSTSVAKYETFLEATCADHRLRGAFQYHGAGTGRWAGRLIQPQNLFNPPEGTNMEELAFYIGMADYELFNIIYRHFNVALPSANRGCIKAPDGKEFYVADYNAIEPRVLAWLTGQDDLIDAFKNNELLYEPMASKIFNKPVVEITKGERFVGKSAVLGCGYSMGPGKFEKQYNVPTTLAERAVAVYRRTYPKIVRFWYALEENVKEALALCERRSFRKLELDGTDPDLFKIILPSGRQVCYPRLTNEGGQLVYKTYKNGKFMDDYTYGGKLTENVVQAIARDLLAEAMYRLDNKGYDIFIHVHDEVGAEVDENSNSFAEFRSIMEELPVWAKGIPLKVEGWVAKRYQK